ncbi:hypothetical protein [Metabacillus litoralis]|uniref:hypothetical protein n=1 Tax=Metabacillus litoralis TaxID=152268 RepID=UPI001315697C|nr:hypothetical protein [Metabacillus litoralis]
MNSTRIMLLGISIMLLGAIITLDTTTTTRGGLLIYPGFLVVLLGFFYGFYKKD